MKTTEKQVPTQALGNIEKIHFVGIGGTGMSGIAEVLFNLGYQISGSDINTSSVTQRLAAQGITIYIGHHPDHINHVDVVVISTAIASLNVEIESAYQQRIPVIPRAEMLAELMRFRFGIAVAGTHGKTTTTSFIASLLAEEGLDPTFVIGGRLNSVGTNAKLGTGQYLVAEADESDASFLYLQPMIAVVTNIDHDHLETYEGSYQRLQNTFIEFLHHLPFYGLAVVCLDDEGVRDILSKISKPVMTYGVHEQADIRAIHINQHGLKTSFTVLRRDQPSLDVTLNMPGRHNMLNAVAAIAIATHLAVSDQAIIASLNEFKGIGRRFQLQGDVPINKGRLTLVDDYGHHPREVAATLDALHQAWPKRRGVVIFQPHRYTRTRDLFEDFVQILSTIDVLILLDIYSAGEALIPEADGQTLCKAIQNHGKIKPIFVPHQQNLLPILKDLLQEEDVVLTMGAGNVGQIARTLQHDLMALFT